jgi:hypothetical protein
MIKKELTLAIDLEKDVKFDIESLINNIMLKYRGHSIVPHINRQGELAYRVQNDHGQYPVLHQIKSIALAKQWVDSQLKRKMGFKPFRAYMEFNGRYVEIKVNSLSKDGTEFNATTVDHSDRISIKKFTRVFRLTKENAKIISQIKEQEIIKQKAHSTIYGLADKLEIDTTIPAISRK